MVQEALGAGSAELRKEVSRVEGGKMYREVILTEELKHYIYIILHTFD